LSYFSKISKEVETFIKYYVSTEKRGGGGEGGGLVELEEGGKYRLSIFLCRIGHI